MNKDHTQQTLIERIVSNAADAAPFGKFERFTAGFCMAIPFYLIIADQARTGENLMMLSVPVLITFLPLLIPRLTRIINDTKNYGLLITVLGGILLFGFYMLVTNVFQLESRLSISGYVRMENSFYFGMLLAIASMLFIASGVAYWVKKEKFTEAYWRSLLSIGLGIFLFGVIIIPCDTFPKLHMAIALIFFIGCAVSSVRRPAKDGKKMQHKLVDFIPVLIMAGAMFAHFGQEFGWVSGRPYSLVNLFGAESIALWITGIDFILVSLNRGMDPREEVNAAAHEMEYQRQ